MSGFSSYVGLSGSGKSYSVVEFVVLPALKKGRQIWTNIPLELDRLRESFGDIEGYKDPVQFDTQDPIKDPNWWMDTLPKGAVLIYDEVQMAFPSGMKATAIPQPAKDFFTQYRHRVDENGNTSEFILLTQDLQNICAFVRNLIGTTYRTTKLDHVGMKKFNVHVYQGPVTGPSPSERNKLTQTGPHSYKKDVYQYYKSATQSSSGSVGDEKKTDQRGNILKSMKLWTMAFFTFALIFGAFQGIQKIWLDMFGTFDEQDEVIYVQESNTSQPSPGVTVPASPVPVRPSPLDLSSLYVSFNNGHGVDRDYRFIYDTGRSRASFALADLHSLGYSVTAINACALYVTWEGRQRLVTCRKPREQLDVEPSNSVDITSPFTPSRETS